MNFFRQYFIFREIELISAFTVQKLSSTVLKGAGIKGFLRLVCKHAFMPYHRALEVIGPIAPDSFACNQPVVYLFAELPPSLCNFLEIQTAFAIKLPHFFLGNE